MELKELKDMIEPVENWEYELSGTRQVGKSYVQNLLNNKDKVINDLLKKISDLEFEVEKQEQVVDKAIEYIENTYIGSILEVHSGYEEEYTQPLLDILKGSDKE